MFASARTRQWLSPLVTVTFVAVTVTGLLMFFHVRLPGMKPLHEYGGLLFAAASMIHLVANWRVLVSYFRKPKGWVTLVAGVVVCLLLMLLSPDDRHEGGRPGGQRDRGERGRTWDHDTNDASREAPARGDGRR